MKKCKINYHTLTDEMRKEEKWEWFSNNKIQNINFEHIIPDKNNNWLNLTDNDWDTMIPVIAKNGSIFTFSSLGVSTNRDEWVYDFNKGNLINKIEYFKNIYNTFNNENNFVEDIKWSRDLKNKFRKGLKLSLNYELIIRSNYRPFSKWYHYTDKILNDVLTQNHYSIYSKNLNIENKVITLSGANSSKPFQVLCVDNLFSLDFLEKTQCLPLYRYTENGEIIDNITDWGLEQFHLNYNDTNICKEEIFHYVYGVLHNPEYRKKYELNLKREFPRIPFYKDFWKWSELGKKLMDLHINFETVEPTQLHITNYELQNEPYKPKLKANKDTGEIYLDNITTLSGIPSEVWDYKLGNRSALEWILDQYKEKKPKDPTIAKLFNTYKFIDYKDKVIDLLMRVTTVSVETMKIIRKMCI